MPKNISLNHGWENAMYEKVTTKPEIMPSVAPQRLARDQKMPITKAGKKEEAANENAADTIKMMSASV